MHAVAQSGAALVADADLDMQLGSTSSYKMDLKVCSTEEEDHAINCDSTMATKARPVLNDPPLPLDLGYLYSVSYDLALHEI